MKQAVIQYSGTVFYTGKDIEYDVSFNFLDENEHSEMASKDNIKEIFIVTEDNERIKVNNWQLYARTFNDYTIRDLYTTINLGGDDQEYILNGISLVYLDGKEENFDIGELRIKDTNYWNADHKVYNSTQTVETVGDFKERQYNILVTLSSIEELTIKLKNIDLGIEGVKVDLNNIKIKENDQEPVDLALSKEIHLDKFSYTTLMIPLNLKEYKEFHKKILVFNPKIEYEKNGNLYTIIGDLNLNITPFIGESDIDEIKASKYIEENGI